MIKPYGGFDLDQLQYLGKGTQGRVYRIDSERCIKIFKSRSTCRDEYITLVIAQNDFHFPKLYFAGENYIIRECINGIELNKYLSEYPLTPSIYARIIEIFDAMMRIGYTQIDSAIFHIFVTPQGTLRVIDTAKALKIKTEYPESFFRGLKRLGYKQEFLNYVKHTRPDLYAKWH